jgi:hypothetical protein
LWDCFSITSLVDFFFSLQRQLKTCIRSGSLWKSVSDTASYSTLSGSNFMRNVSMPVFPKSKMEKSSFIPPVSDDEKQNFVIAS